MPDAPETPTLDEETFRELAQASQRLWRTIEFEHTDRERGTVHAWVRRPFDLRVETADGTVVVDSTRPGVPGAAFHVSFDPDVGEVDRDSLADAAELALWGGEPSPTGTTATWAKAPDHDPMYENYRWVAMLQPHELSVGSIAEDAYDRVADAGLEPETLVAGPGVLVDRVWPEDRFGRRTWWAELCPDPATYEPRCSCCPLLAGEASDRLEYGDESTHWRSSEAGFSYTTQFLVALDVETGVCVCVDHLDGTDTGEELTVRIVAVEEPMGDDLFATPSRRARLVTRRREIVQNARRRRV